MSMTNIELDLLRKLKPSKTYNQTPTSCHIKGQPLILRIHGGDEDYMLAAAIQASRVDFDISDVGEAMEHNTALPAHWKEQFGRDDALKKITIEGEGIYSDRTAKALLHRVNLDPEPARMKVVMHGLGTFQGLFRLVTYHTPKKYHELLTFRIRLEAKSGINFWKAMG